VLIPMLIPSQQTTLLPAIPTDIQTQFGAETLVLRPFGELAADLDINFRGLRPEVEVQLLHCCTQGQQGQRCERNLFWHLDVSKRTECLVALAMLTDQGQGTMALRCPHPQCQQFIEIDLSMAELASLQSGADTRNQPVHPVQIGNEILLMRKPTGLDQRQWLQQAFTDESTLMRGMLMTLVAEAQQEQLQRLWSEQPDWLTATRQTLSQAMTSLDPLVNFSLRIVCPECQTQFQQSLDLGVWALRRLEQIQQQLLRLVHRLAAYYHWSEAEIFAIPPWRRQQYLALVDQEAGG
jgi:hypothetical protein